MTDLDLAAEFMRREEAAGGIGLADPDKIIRAIAKEHHMTPEDCATAIKAGLSATMRAG